MKLKSRDFEKRLAKLQVELVKLQLWVQRKGLKVVVIFEGRDAAGKGGVVVERARTNNRLALSLLEIL